MFNAKRNSGRRAFLGGVGGVALGLPLLEFTHERAWAAVGDPLKRFVLVFAHGGETMNLNMDGERANGTGTGPKLDDWLPKAGWKYGEALETFRGTALEQKLLVLRGVDNKIGYETFAYRGSHEAGPPSVLAQTVIDNPTDSQTSTPRGPSFDWLLAKRLHARLGGRPTPLSCEVWGFRYRTGFFAGEPGQPGQEQEGYGDPAKLWSSAFNGVTSSGEGPDPAVVRAQATRKSVLNGLMDGYRDFGKQLGLADKAIVDAHFDHLSDLEKQIELVAQVTQCTVPGKPGADPSWSDPHQSISAPVLADLIVAALRCGLTNVANLEIGDLMTPLYDTHQPDGHDLGHRIQLYGGGDAGDDYLKQILASGNYPAYSEWLNAMRVTRRWRIGLAKRIAEGLNDPAFPEAGGTMLDNSLVMYTNENSCGGNHTVSRDIPVALLGGGNRFKTGQFVDFNTKRQANPEAMGWGNTASHAQVFTTILNAFGEPDTSFGDPRASYSTGGLSQLLK